MFLRKLCYTVNMLKRCLKIFILAAMLCLGMALTSFAAGKEKTVPFPFALELDLEECDRLCYAGHPGNTVQYRDGLAATPDSEFRILNVGGSADVKYLSLEIAVSYENEDQTGSYRETVRRFEPGDLDLSNTYSLFSENTIKSLEERGKLYSDSLKGIEVTMRYDFRDSKKKTQYLYICSEDDYFEYLDKMYENGEGADG